MNIQFGHSRIGDYVNDFYIPLKENFKEHNFLLPHEVGKSTPDSKKTLKQQDVFLCEVSNNSTGLGIEIGFATIYGVRTICMYEKGSKISGSLAYVTEEIFEYEDKEDMIRKLTNIL